MRILALAPTLLALSVGCVPSSGDTPSTSISPPPPASATTRSTIQRTCAPWDGPAFTLVLYPGVDEYPRSHVSIYAPLPTNPEVFTVSDGTQRVGFAARCQRQGACSPARSFELHLQAVDPAGTVSGTLRLIHGGQQLNYVFSARWLPNAALCG